MVKSGLVMALTVALHNAMSSAPAMAALVLAGATLTGSADFIGNRGIAVIFALLGAAWRWYHFDLSWRRGSSGLFLSSMLAFALGGGSIPLIGETIRSIDPDSVAMWNGLLIGLFNVLIFGALQDFLEAYAKRRKEAA